MGIAFVEHLAGIQQHRALSKLGKVTFNLVVVHHAVLWNDPFKQ